MSNWTRAQQHVGQAVNRLTVIRCLYEMADDLPVGVRRARLRALDAKIDALRAVQLDGDAYPWCEDGVRA